MFQFNFYNFIIHNIYNNYFYFILSNCIYNSGDTK